MVARFGLGKSRVRCRRLWERRKKRKKKGLKKEARKEKKTKGKERKGDGIAIQRCFLVSF